MLGTPEQNWLGAGAWLGWVWGRVGMQTGLGLAWLGWVWGRVGMQVGARLGWVWGSLGLSLDRGSFAGLDGLQGGSFWTGWARERLSRAVAGHLSVRKKKEEKRRALPSIPVLRSIANVICYQYHLQIAGLYGP
ncbi:hypothetical protein BY996DRAFT_6522757 [Phakopsora pachyrhizi]|nr:hypothetical protein BY996DRAFT_6522757 [Phakopsora pachyrhizi]